MNELTLVIISILLITMVCLPLLINHSKQKNKGNLLKEQLKSEGDASHLKARDFETWRESYCIGLDQENKQLLFLNRQETETKVQKIDLSQVRLCKPIRTFREINKGKEKIQIINKVTLVLDQFNEHIRPFEVEIYNEDLSDYLVNEWELAQTWSKKINELRN
ncbi:hypothetical protein LV84_02433 [Algoriphagus ratkowskyi]|uniref:Uncharacterized protein n=1 Tax=Algoriphagus ratkowskyi TaxID=57028 RepID=A0A2W7RYW3_9BACT|nr:hypothetical protein [Algoriphagus ratkowskyi]PZX56065.1 hypothetical protein LV84_02433 [Algoriphagus ratkowskyi]TXD77130.1 hypothetical protein ESW18_12575 [Algoriphagus ratkowskyi]